MKRGLVFMIAMMIGTIAFAQKGNPGMRYADRMEHMKTALALDDKQYATIKEIHQKYDQRRVEIKSQAPAGQSNYEAMRSLRDEKRKEVEAVLTPDQKTKWETYRRENAEKRKALNKNYGPQRAERMKTELGLSAEQAKKMQEVHTSFRSEVQKLNLEKGERRSNEAFQKAKADHDAAIKSILTAEQYQKWVEMRGRGKRHGKK